jgi:patatin-related protein
MTDSVSSSAQADTAEGGLRPRFAREQEVRLAVVMYGGVSLAVYINGVAQELFNLVKATAPEVAADPAAPQSLGDRVYFGDPGSGGARPSLSGSQVVYRELGQSLGVAGAEKPRRGDDEPPLDGAEPRPVKTRFVVDIVSGTSAGGINGVLLAQALANREDFAVSADLWLAVADITELLADEDSWGGVPPSGRRVPESLLNGTRLYWEARAAMGKMHDGRDGPGDDGFEPSYAEQVDLAVTSTDLAGRQLPLRLGAERFIDERVYKKVFEFEYGTDATIGERHSDFKDNDLMLAFAARATSSFPFAFEPVRLEDLRSIDEADAAFDPRRWFAGYDDPASAFFADGGYLDNKPFSYATRALRRRRADVPVVRKLLYIEPNPAAETPGTPEDAPPPPPPAPPARPNVFQNIGDALVVLPRFEPIRQDIAEVAERNGVVARLRDIELDAEAVIDRALQQGAPAPELGTGLATYAYESLRVRIVLDHLTAVAALLRGWTSDDDPRSAALRQRLRDWVDEERSTRESALLATLDGAFRQRRLSFLQDRANRLLRERASRSDADDGEARALRDFKRELNDGFDALRRAERAPVAQARDHVPEEPPVGPLKAVWEAARQAQDDPGGYVAAMQAFLANPLRAADAAFSAALDAAALSAPISEQLRTYDERFTLFDSLVLPLAYPDLGEVNVADIRRISPRDARNIIPDDAAIRENEVTKLAGVRLNNFGAFLDRSWRENDLMWGRLDAAEGIVDAVLDGQGDDVREYFRVRAQAAILRECRPALAAEVASGSPEDPDGELVKTFLVRYETPDPNIPADSERKLLRRALRITRRVLADGAAGYGVPPWPVRALGRVASVVVRWLRRRSREQPPGA